MTYLCINDLNNISYDNIYIKESNDKYQIYYKYENILINGILFSYKDKIIKNNKYIHLIATENHKYIDEILSKKIKNYNSFINDDHIIIKINYKMNSLLKDNKNEYYLNLSYINKYNNTPILYIVK
tara:strand:+ start:14 stop:391 length:378 start_codon:yes stop_codon:yes gene_type:complete